MRISDDDYPALSPLAVKCFMGRELEKNWECCGFERKCWQLWRLCRTSTVFADHGSRPI